MEMMDRIECVNEDVLMLLLVLGSGTNSLSWDGNPW